MFNIEKVLIPVFIMATLLTVAIIAFFIFTFTRIRGRKIKKEHDTLKVINEERERTMNAIAVEIHNNVNQVLGLALLTLNMVGKSNEVNQKKYLADTAKMLNEAMRDLRAISHSLNAGYLKMRGLQESLEEECKRLNNAGKLYGHLDVEGKPMSFNEETELILIRIAQEAIQNVLKHARAQKLDMVLVYESHLFQMCIQDNGQGFVMDPQTTWKGMGLQSIKNQSRIIEGCTVDVDAAPGKGTVLTLSIKQPQYLKFEKNRASLPKTPGARNGS